MLKKGDIILLISLLIVIAGGFGGIKLLQGQGKDSNMVAVVKQDGRELYRIDLNQVKEPKRLEVSGDYDETLLVEKGRIRFEEANCPDRVCVRTGWLSHEGDTAVCLPNRTIITIGGSRQEVDGATF